MGGGIQTLPVPEHEQWKGWLLFLPMLLLLVMGYWHLWWFLPRRQFNPAWRSVAQTTATGEMVHLRPMKRMGLVWMFVLGTVYGVLFIVGLPVGGAVGTDGVYPGRNVLAGVYVTIGLLMAFRAWLWSRLTDYVYDDTQTSTLSWRSWHFRGRVRSMVQRSVVRHWVTDVDVQAVLIPPFDTTVYTVVIDWTTRDGERKREPIVSYPYEADAEALAGWIRMRLGLHEHAHSLESALAS